MTARRVDRAGLIEVDGRLEWAKADYAPSAQERAAQERRIAAIDAALAHRDNAAVARALLRMFAALKSASGDMQAAADSVTVYTDVLSDLPAWAVVVACDTCARGHGPSAAFSPSAGELHRMVEPMVEDLRRERDDRRAVLAARIPTRPPPRAKRATLEELQARHGKDWGLGGDGEAERAARRAAAHARLDAWQDDQRRRQLAAAGIDPDSTASSLALLRQMEGGGDGEGT